MDFNTAVERIGFTLAVLLYENELPENFWQTVTLERCFFFIRADDHHDLASALVSVGSRKVSEDILGSARKRALEIFSESDFTTADQFYKLCKGLGHHYWPWQKDACKRMRELAATFEEWYRLYELKKKEYRETDHKSIEYYETYEKERYLIVQKLYGCASTREDWVKLSAFSGPHQIGKGKTLRWVTTTLSRDQYMDVASRLLADNPTDEEVVRLGYRFAPDSPEYINAFNHELSSTVESKDICKLHHFYLRFRNCPSPRVQIATAIKEWVDVIPEEWVLANLYRMREISDAASDCGDEDLANELYAVVVQLAEKEEDPRNARHSYEWIVGCSDPDGEVYKKFKALVPEDKRKGKRKKKEVEV